MKWSLSILPNKQQNIRKKLKKDFVCERLRHWFPDKYLLGCLIKFVQLQVDYFDRQNEAEYDQTKEEAFEIRNERRNQKK